MTNKDTKKTVPGKRRAKFDKVNALDLKKRGRWVTVNGKHKFIEEK